MARKTNQESLGQVIDRLLEVYRLRSGLHQITIQSHWPDIVGQAIAARTGVIKLRGHKLEVEILSAAMRQELFYRRDELRKTINDYLGKEIVTFLELK